MKAVSNIPLGKVKCLTVSGMHNCCEPIKETVATVKGGTGDTIKPKATSFEVAGDFYAAALVRALNAAGFSAQVEHCFRGGR